MVQNTGPGVRRPWVSTQGLLSQRVFAYLLLNDAAKLPSKEVRPSYTPTNCIKTVPAPPLSPSFPICLMKKKKEKKLCLHVLHWHYSTLP